MGMGSTHATRMATASARSTSTRWKGPGRCCAPGSARTEASRRRSCRCISASSSSSTTPGAAAKPSSAPSSRLWWDDERAITPDPNKSHVVFTQKCGLWLRTVPPKRRRRSVQPLARFVGDDQLVLGDHVQQNPGALVELVAVYALAAEAGDAALQGVALRFGADEHGARRRDVTQPLLARQLAVVAVDRMPREVPTQRGETQRRQGVAHPPLQLATERHGPLAPLPHPPRAAPSQNQEPSLLASVTCSSGDQIRHRRKMVRP